jgi:hypothetical protein
VCRKPRNASTPRRHVYTARVRERVCFDLGWAVATHTERKSLSPKRTHRECLSRSPGIFVLEPKVTQYPHVLESRRLGRINYIRRPAQEEIPYSALLWSHHSSPALLPLSHMTLWSIRSIYKRQRVRGCRDKICFFWSISPFFGARAGGFMCVEKKAAQATCFMGWKINEARAFCVKEMKWRGSMRALSSLMKSRSHWLGIWTPEMAGQLGPQFTRAPLNWYKFSASTLLINLFKLQWAFTSNWVVAIYFNSIDWLKRAMQFVISYCESNIII